MGLDEVGTARVLREHRAVIDAIVAKHGGRLVKTTGDGVLLEFPSVVDAVECAVVVQATMAQRNEGIPQDQRMLFRIGINLGDILIEGDDILGDGVNVAARLEGIAEPGGICVSSSAYEQVRGKVPVEFIDLGEQILKNIARPVRAYAAVRDGVHPHSVAGRAMPSPTSAPQSSIVVLPFMNLSGDPEQQYLADVLTENLTTGLARIPGAFVIARSTAFTYKGKPIDVKQIGKDLGVRYALEGSAQPSDSKVRVTAQFIDAETGAHLWADQFDADRSNLLDMQDEIVVRLSRALLFQYVAVDIARSDRMRPGNLDAEDLAMRCVADLIKGPTGWATAPGLCDRALQIDPRNVLALGLSAYMIIIPVILAQSDDPIAATRRADELVSRALAVDPNFDYAHIVKAWVLMAQNRQEEAIVEAERGLALNPSNTEAYTALGVANLFLCRPDRSIEAVDKAIRLSPRDPSLGTFYEIKAEAYFIKREDANTIEWIRRSTATVHQILDPYGALLLASASALSGQQAEAGEAIKAYLADGRTKSRTISQFQKQQLAMANNPKWLAYNERFAEGLRKAGLPD